MIRVITLFIAFSFAPLINAQSFSYGVDCAEAQYCETFDSVPLGSFSQADWFGMVEVIAIGPPNQLLEVNDYVSFNPIFSYNYSSASQFEFGADLWVDDPVGGGPGSVGIIQVILTIQKSNDPQNWVQRYSNYYIDRNGANELTLNGVTVPQNTPYEFVHLSNQSFVAAFIIGSAELYTPTAQYDAPRSNFSGFPLQGDWEVDVNIYFSQQNGSGVEFKLDNVIFDAAERCEGRLVTVDMELGETTTSGDDVVKGTDGDDLIVAMGGNDVICGFGGNDTINAGPGDDWVYAGDGDDQVFGLAGADILSGGMGADEIVAGAGNDLVNGNDGNDTLNGGPDDDMVNGGAGDDDIYGQGGDDILNGEEGNDFIIGVDGTDIINGGTGNDTLNGGPGNDTVNGNDGSDTVFGLTGDDTLDGGLGDDSVFGQLGNDTISGGGGDDLLIGNDGDDVVIAASGSNIINGGPGNDTLTGGIGNDQIFGDGNVLQAGNDVIDGGGDMDLLIGYAGADTITSTDGGVDTVNGGPDIDVCTTDTVDVVFNCP